MSSVLRSKSIAQNPEGCKRLKERDNDILKTMFDDEDIEHVNDELQETMMETKLSSERDDENTKQLRSLNIGCEDKLFSGYILRGTGSSWTLGPDS